MRLQKRKLWQPSYLLLDVNLLEIWALSDYLLLAPAFVPSDEEVAFLKDGLGETVEAGRSSRENEQTFQLDSREFRGSSWFRWKERYRSWFPRRLKADWSVWESCVRTVTVKMWVSHLNMGGRKNCPSCWKTQASSCSKPRSGRSYRPWTAVHKHLCNSIRRGGISIRWRTGGARHLRFESAFNRRCL
jgi:hypothetical protein